MEEEYLEIEVRPAGEIAARVLILHALFGRLVVEQMEADDASSDDDPDELLFDLNAFLVDSHASSHLTAGDRQILEAPVGKLEDDLALEIASWRHAQHALLSVCGLISDGGLWLDVAEGESNLDELDLQKESVRSLTGKITLPSDEVAAAVRETAELWLWRIETEAELRLAGGPARRELLNQISETTKEAAEAGLIRPILGGDFFAGDRTIRDWSDEELALITVAAVARLRGLNWLCGFGESWDNTPIYV